MQNSKSIVSLRFTLLMRWSIVLSLAVLLVSMAAGQTGIANYLELQKNRENLYKIREELAVRNQTLREQIQKLSSSKEEQMRYLKENFGYVESGEFVYHFETLPPALDSHEKKNRVEAAINKSQPKI